MLPLLDTAPPVRLLRVLEWPSSTGEWGNNRASACSPDGPLRCLFRYVVDDTERGRFGRGDEGDRRPGLSALYDDFRLGFGLLVLDGAGDCCAGGV